MRNRHGPNSNLIGTKLGRLTVVSFSHKVETAPYYWCLCDCGKRLTVNYYNMSHGRSVSCGCFRKEATSVRLKTHGQSNTNIYRVWKSIKDRCFLESSKCFKNYGGRGITMCSEWKHSFELFVRDMGPCPKGFTIERINNELGYVRGNCIWASHKTQQRNKRSNLVLEYHGQSKCAAEWAELYGVPYQSFIYRISHGWGMEQALTKPIRGRK